MDVAKRSFTDVGSPDADVGCAEIDVAQCQRMLRMLEGQLADLEKAAASLRDIQARWRDRLLIARAPTLKGSAGRAPHGAVKQSVLSELGQSPDGMTLAELHVSIAGNIGDFNRRALSLALNRLKADGAVEHREHRWRMI